MSRVKHGTMMRTIFFSAALVYALVYPIGAFASPEKPGLFRSGLSTTRPPDTRYRLTDHWLFGAQIELDMERTRDFDLDSREDDDVLLTDPTVQLAFAYRSDSWLSGFLDLELGKEYLLEDPDGQTSRSTRLEVVQLWLEGERADGNMRLRLGRQDFEDERTWLFDEELDGARAYFSSAVAEFEFSLTRRNLASRDLLNSTENERINNYLALARFGGEDDDGGDSENEASLYALYRDGRRRDTEDLLFVGLQAVGELSDDADYWLNIIGVTGDSDGNDVRAYGFDAGLVYSLDSILEPSVTVSLAYGSGDSNPDGRDGNFRQTGLQANDAEMSGVTDIEYYGHALDPELSNLLIVTLGLGIAPTDRSSLELLYHHYRQAEAFAELRDSNLDVDPDGEHRELGQALDVVFGYVIEDYLEFELTAGWFFPEAAFENDASAAFFGGLEFIYLF